MASMIDFVATLNEAQLDEFSQVRDELLNCTARDLAIDAVRAVRNAQEAQAPRKRGRPRKKKEVFIA